MLYVCVCAVRAERLFKTSYTKKSPSFYFLRSHNYEREKIDKEIDGKRERKELCAQTQWYAVLHTHLVSYLLLFQLDLFGKIFCHQRWCKSWVLSEDNREVKKGRPGQTQCTQTHFWHGRQDVVAFGKRQQDEGENSTSVLPRPDGGVSRVTRIKKLTEVPPLLFLLHMLFFLEFLPKSLLVLSCLPMPKVDPLWDRFSLAFWGHATVEIWNPLERQARLYSLDVTRRQLYSFYSSRNQVSRQS